MNQDTLNLLFTAVIIPLLPILTAYVVAFIKKKTQELETKIQNDNANKYINIAENAISTSVGAVMQTYVDSLKKSGTFDSEAQNIAFSDAKVKALSIMGEATKEALKESYGDIDTFIDNKIEQYIKLYK